jgi:hypothetical protein
MRAAKIDELQKIRMGLRYLRSLKGDIMKGYLCRSFSVSLTVQEMPADVVMKRASTIPRRLSLNLCVNLLNFCVIQFESAVTSSQLRVMIGASFCGSNP